VPELISDAKLNKLLDKKIPNIEKMTIKRILTPTNTNELKSRAVSFYNFYCMVNKGQPWDLKNTTFNLKSAVGIYGWIVFCITIIPS
jgi:hypothetical protein